MSKYKVLAPDPDPALTGFPVEVSEHTKIEAALDAAKDAARDLKKRASVVQVEEPGTNNVWTVSYHPEPPVATGEVDESGIPQFAFIPEFRIVHDGREEQYGDAHPETGEVPVLGLAGPHTVENVEAS